MGARPFSADYGETAASWVLPKLGSDQPAGGVAGARPQHHFTTLAPSAHLDAIMRAAQEQGHSDGYSAGYEKGLTEGRESGRAEAAKANQGRAGELFALVQSLEKRVLECDEALAVELAKLVAEAVELLVREELSLRPELILSVVRTGLNAFVESRKVVEIKLHPDDADQVGEIYHDKAPVEISRDPSSSRGGCYLSNGETELDLTLEFGSRQMRQALIGRSTSPSESG